MSDAHWSSRRTSFGSQADAYAVGRPTYPMEAVEWVVAPGARRALDLAAGTGRLTERLLDLGLDVVAVEPLDEMRGHIPSAATAMAGTAEDIPLGDASVDCVVVGQAFHWFDAPAAMAEIARVLRPGGTLGLLWNLADDCDAVTAQVCNTIGDDEVRASSINPDQAPPYADIAGMTVPERRMFRHHDDYDADRAAALVLSMSRTILLPEAERLKLVEQVRDVVPAGTFAFWNVCEVWRGERRD